jgi:hypothetical protein
VNKIIPSFPQKKRSGRKERSALSFLMRVEYSIRQRFLVGSFLLPLLSLSLVHCLHRLDLDREFPSRAVETQPACFTNESAYSLAR